LYKYTSMPQTSSHLSGASRISNEIEHGRKIAQNAEKVWNWDSPAGRKRAQRRADYLISLGGFKRSEKILELGCGTGVFTEKIFSATGAQIIAVDISPELLAQAEKKIKQVTFQAANAMQLCFENESFDAVYGSSILHHLEMEQSAREILRILKKKGRMVFAEPNMLNPQILIERKVGFVKGWLGISPDETAISRWQFKKMLQRIGFINVRIFPYDFLHPATPKRLIGFVERLGRVIEKIPLIREIAGSVIIYAEKS
jgi:ubiquinone/menaquinone biosynthesis C-methylase UbiE